MGNNAPGFLKNLGKYMPGPQSKYKNQKPGFWIGFLHGIILPFTFVYRQYETSVKLFETDNLGSGYNFGIVIGIIGLVRIIIGNV